MSGGPRLRLPSFLLCGPALLVSAGPLLAQDLSVTLGQGGIGERALQLVALLTALSVAPSLLVMVTSFTRIVVALSLLRSALGTQSAPPRVVVRAMKSRIDRFTGPSFQEGSPSACANPGLADAAIAVAPMPLRNIRRLIAGSSSSR